MSGEDVPDRVASKSPDGDGSVTLVGTAHVSSKSAERVEETISEERPDIVAVELDKTRYRQFKGETPEDIDPKDLLGGGTVFQFIAYWILSYVQNRMGSRFGVEPGADMRAAIETAESFGIDVALVDRDIQTTIQRFWSRLTFTEKLKLVGGLAIGAAKPTSIGITLGVTIGLFVGVIAGVIVAPVFGYGSIFALGLGSTAVVNIIGGAVLGALGGLIVALTFAPSVGLIQRAVAGVGIGVAAGVYLAASGTALPLVGTIDFATTGERILRAVVGGTIGVLGGTLLGIALGFLFRTDVEQEELTEDRLEELTDTDVVTAMIEEFRQFSPGGAEALIDERDAFIAHKLLGLREAGYDVVAVVGAGHRAGIESYLQDPDSLPPLDSITGTESGSRFSFFKLFGYVVMIGFLLFFFLLAMAGVQNTLLLQIFLAWFAFNGIFAFTAARLAGAKLPSALVGGSVAWLTSINPLLAPGWFAGYVELRYRPVNIADIGRLNELLEDQDRPIGDVLRDMYDVPLFRLITVVALTNVGSFIATILFPIVVLSFFFEGVSGVSEIGDMMVEGAQNSIRMIGDLL